MVPVRLDVKAAPEVAAVEEEVESEGTDEEFLVDSEASDDDDF